MFDKVVRHFYDDTCVVPEKVEGESSHPVLLNTETTPCGVTLKQRAVMVLRVCVRRR